MSRPRLMAALERANDAGCRCALRSPCDARRQIAGSYRTRTFCASAPRPASADRGAEAVLGATPQSEGLLRVRRQVRLRTPVSSPSGRSQPAIPPGEGCRADEVGYARHHRGRRRGRGRPGAQGAVPGHRRQPGARPDRLPRSGSARSDPRLVLRVARRRRRACRLVHALGLAGLVPAAREAAEPGQAAQVAGLAER